MTDLQQQNQQTTSMTGKILVALTGGVALGLMAVTTPFLIPALRKHCLPYIPATPEQITNIFNALKGRKGKLLDIGSGDGRIVLEAAKRGFVAHGVELNPWLVLYSKAKAFKLRSPIEVRFFRKDLWKFNFSTYDNFVIFGVEEMMAALEKKLSEECKIGAEIVACRFPLPNMKPVKTVGSGIDTVWVYCIRNR